VSLSANIVTSKIATAQRWMKLYRNIYHMFLKRDFAHKLDYLQDLMQINQRITELETKISTELAKIQAGIAAHTHISGGPGSPTSPPTSPPYTSGFSPTKPIVHQDTNSEQWDGLQQATGPSLAPLGDGISIEAQLATTTAQSDVGI